MIMMMMIFCPRTYTNTLEQTLSHRPINPRPYTHSTCSIGGVVGRG